MYEHLTEDGQVIFERVCVCSTSLCSLMFW